MRVTCEPLALRPRLPGARAALALLIGTCALLAACAKPPAETVPESEIAPDPVLPFEAWRRDVLDCSADRCELLYEIDVPEPGRVRADVYAPLDPGGPDFDLSLLDADGDAIAHPSDQGARPRRLAYLASPGRYQIRVAGRGDAVGPLRYELVAYFTPDAKAPKQPRPKPTFKASKPATPAPKIGVLPGEPAVASKPEPAAPAGVLMTAEVLGIEREEGGVFVLLEVGSREGVRPQMRGVLRDGANELARFVVVEVYDDGSRARVEGTLEGEVGIDTEAAILR